MKQQKSDGWEIMSLEAFSGRIWPLASLLQIFMDSETRVKLDDIEPNYQTEHVKALTTEFYYQQTTLI